jgi:hypothetical protein
MPEVSEEDLFDEWRELFTKYRSFGSLPGEERARFRKLSKEMIDRGIIKRPSKKKVMELLNIY